MVIDAGHGGQDVGARSQDGTAFEKDMTLAILKKIKALNNNSNINLVLTRETDLYQDPKEKVTIVVRKGQRYARSVAN